MALTPHPAHPTKKTGGETNQNQQKALTTFTENDTMVHYKTKGGAICVQRVLLISWWGTVIVRALCQIKAHPALGRKAPRGLCLRKREDGSRKGTKKIHALFNMLLKQEWPLKSDSNVCVRVSPCSGCALSFQEEKFLLSQSNLNFLGSQWSPEGTTKLLCLHSYLGIVLKSTISAQSWIPNRNSFTVTLFQISSTTLCCVSIFEPFGPGWKALTFKSCFQYFCKKWDRFRVEWVIYSLFCLANTPKIWPLIALDPVPWLGGACQRGTPLCGRGPGSVTNLIKQSPVVISAAQSPCSPGTDQHHSGENQPRTPCNPQNPFSSLEATAVKQQELGKGRGWR